MNKNVLALALILLCACTLSEEVGTSLEPAPERQAAALVEQPSPVIARRLVDLEIKPLDSYGRAGEPFAFSTRLTSRGIEPTFQVLLTHEIRSIPDMTLLVSKDETIGLETISSKRTDMILPRAAKKGRYVLETKASYESGYADSSFEFDLEPAVVVAKLVVANAVKPSSSNATLVIITGLGYNPRELTLRKGDLVVWKNTDTTSHTATGAGFDLVLRAGESGSHYFNESRVYSYGDTFSGIQPGLITVKE